jgi:hypothetical protein
MGSVLKVLITGALLMVATAQAANGEPRLNRVGGELLGRGLALTLNYERFFTPHLGVGAGIMHISVDDGSITIFPVYGSYLSGGTHNLYAGAGATFLGGGGSIQDYEGTTLLTAALGYEYQSAGGFFIRPLFTALIPTEGDAGALVWPGIVIGGSF